jgi:hypothetical protein
MTLNPKIKEDISTHLVEFTNSHPLLAKLVILALIALITGLLLQYRSTDRKNNQAPRCFKWVMV